MVRLEKLRARFALLMLLGLPVYALYNVWFPTVPLQERAILGLLATLAFFTSTTPRSNAWIAADLVHVVLAILTFGYLIVEWQGLLLRQGAPNQADIFLGVIGVYLILVATVRSLGLGLAIVVGAFLAYTFLGEYLPVWLGGHRGYSLSRTFTFLYTNENGIMGFAMDACLKYMALFLLLGKVLQYTGALSSIMDFARALFGSGTTGPPLMAVLSSALVGTVSGSSMGNVYISGQVTIPLMKRVGVPPALAGAIEAAASNGSQIIPPVMGFAVFFMVVLLDVTYFEIMAAAIIPGILYFLAVAMAVWARVRRLPPLEDARTVEENRPSVGQAVKRMGTLSLVATIATLVYLLAERESLQLAAIYAMALCIAISMLGRDRMTPTKAFGVLRDSGKELVDVAIACLALGLVTGPILLTGLGTKLPALMMNWASGDLVLLLITSFLACMVLGLGVPTRMAYVIVALLISGAITQLGVPLLDAHMFVFYAALAAMITPPVALSAYAAATIAGANFWKTGVLAAMLAIPSYLVPFAFVFRPELLMRGDPLDIVAVTSLTGLGLVALGVGLAVRNLRTPGGAARAGALAGGGFLLAVPPLDSLTLALGGALVVSGTLPVALRSRGLGKAVQNLRVQ